MIEIVSPRLKGCSKFIKIQNNEARSPRDCPKRVWAKFEAEESPVSVIANQRFKVVETGVGLFGMSTF